MADTTIIPTSTVGWTEITTVGNKNLYIISTGFYSFYIGINDPETDGHSVWPRMGGNLVVKQPGESIWLNGHGTTVISVIEGGTTFEMEEFSNLTNNGEPE